MGNEFRARLRARFAEHHPGPPPKGRDAGLVWQRCLVRDPRSTTGSRAPVGRVKHGGMELSFEEQVVYAE